jgi:hypothetical protein
MGYAGSRCKQVGCLPGTRCRLRLKPAGGKIGGKRSLETMTPEARTARAKKAAAASAKVRSKKVKARAKAKGESDA